MELIKRAHPSHKKTVEDANRFTFEGGISTKAVVTEKARNIFSWLETVMSDFELFTFVEKKLICKKMKMQPNCYGSLCYYILKVTKYVKSEVSRMLRDKFAFVLDDWSVGY